MPVRSFHACHSGAGSASAAETGASRVKDRRRPHVPREEQVAAQAEGEEELGQRKRPVGLGQAEGARAPQLRGKNKVLVGVQDPLGLAGRSARVVEGREVVPVRAGGHEVGGPAVDPFGEGDIAGGCIPGGCIPGGCIAVHDDHVFEERTVGARHSKSGQQLGVDHEHAGAAVVEDERDLARRQQRAQARGDTSALEGTEERRDPLGRIETEDRHRVTDSHVHGTQGVCDPVRGIGHAPEAELSRLRVERSLVRMTCDAALEDVGGVVVDREIGGECRGRGGHPRRLRRTHERSPRVWLTPTAKRMQ